MLLYSDSESQLKSCILYIKAECFKETHTYVLILIFDGSITFLIVHAVDFGIHRNYLYMHSTWIMHDS